MKLSKQGLAEQSSKSRSKLHHIVKKVTPCNSRTSHAAEVVDRATNSEKERGKEGGRSCWSLFNLGNLSSR